MAVINETLNSIYLETFITDHGKGAIDGIGVIVKRYVQNKVHAKTKIVRNSTDFVKMVHQKHN